MPQFRSTKDRYYKLWNAYIERMLNRKKTSAKYPKEKVLPWLSWLAERMVQESQTVFSIENMQPTWLKSRGEKRVYQIIIFLFGWLIPSLFYGLIIGLVFYWRYSELIYSIFLGTFLGIIIGLAFGIIVVFSKKIMLFEKINWSWQRAKFRVINEFIYGLIICTITGLIVGLVRSIVLLIIPLICDGLNYSINNIQSIIIYLLVCLVYGLSLGIFLGLIFAISSGLDSAEVKQKTVSNQGIKSSAKNCMKWGLILGLIAWVIFGLIPGLFLKSIELVIFGLIPALFLRIIYGLRYGGATCIQHFNLRLMLYKKGHIPWNYARFLDYASERLLLKKVGGGYIFYHRMLMEYFADRD